MGWKIYLKILIVAAVWLFAVPPLISSNDWVLFMMGVAIVICSAYYVINAIIKRIKELT